MNHKISYESHHGGYIVFQVKKDGRDMLIQSDWDFTRLAEVFGWRGLQGHDGTDGTVSCPHCGAPASFFIEAASRYLSSNEGKVILDRGGFLE